MKTQTFNGECTTIFQECLYQALKKNWDEYYNKRNTVVYQYFFTHFEKKDRPAGPDIRYLTELIRNHELSDLVTLHENLTFYKNQHIDPFIEINEKIKDYRRNDPDYQFNCEFPTILRFLIYKIDRCKSVSNDKQLQNNKLKKSLTHEIMTSDRSSLIELMNLFDEIETISRSYDFLSKLSTGKTEKANKLLCMLQLLCENEKTSPNEIFFNEKFIKNNSYINKTYFRRNDLFVPIFIPICVDKITGTMLILIGETRSAQQRRFQNEYPGSINNKINISNTKKAQGFQNSRTAAESVYCYYYLYGWKKTNNSLSFCIHNHYSVEDSKGYTDAIKGYNHLCQDSLSLFQSHNRQLADKKILDDFPHLMPYILSPNKTRKVNTFHNKIKQNRISLSNLVSDNKSSR